MKLKKPQDSLKRQDKNWIKKFSPLNRGSKANNSISLFKVQHVDHTGQRGNANHEQRGEELNSSKADQDNSYGISKDNTKKKSPMKSVHTLSEVLQKREKSSLSLISTKNRNFNHESI